MNDANQLLDMENPWVLGGAEGTGFALEGGSDVGHAAGGADGTDSAVTAVFDTNGTVGGKVCLREKFFCVALVKNALPFNR